MLALYIDLQSRDRKKYIHANYLSKLYIVCIIIIVKVQADWNYVQYYSYVYGMSLYQNKHLHM